MEIQIVKNGLYSIHKVVYTASLYFKQIMIQIITLANNDIIRATWYLLLKKMWMQRYFTRDFRVEMLRFCKNKEGCIEKAELISTLTTTTLTQTTLL